MRDKGDCERRKAVANLKLRDDETEHVRADEQST